MTGKRLSKSRYSTTFQLRLVSTQKSIVKHLCYWQEGSFNFLSFEGKCISFGAGKPKFRWFKFGHFCDKKGPLLSNFSKLLFENPAGCLYKYKAYLFLFWDFWVLIASYSNESINAYCWDGIKLRFATIYKIRKEDMTVHVLLGRISQGKFLPSSRK